MRATPSVVEEGGGALPIVDDARSDAEPEVFRRLAGRLLPGGVNSPTRLLECSDGRRSNTLYFEEGSGSRIRDVAGRWYVDLHMCAGAAMLGHRAEALEGALVTRLGNGLCFAFSHPLEGLVAARLRQRFPWLDRLRYVTSGSEAVASAIGTARTKTGCRTVLAFRECYHGWLIQQDQEITWLSLAKEDVIADFLATHGADLAAVIIEPIPASNGVLPPPRALLERLRTWCTDAGTLLIFDEVITGFRVGFGGASRALGITPDLITLGKALSGGFPLAVYGGTEEAMSAVAPPGAWYQGGTLAAHPVGLEAALVMHEMLTPDFYRDMERRGAALEEALTDVSVLAGPPLSIVRAGSMLSVYRGARPPESGDLAMRASLRPYGAFHRAMLDEGVFLQAQVNKPMFLSVAHDEDAIDAVRKAFLRAGRQLEA